MEKTTYNSHRWRVSKKSGELVFVTTFTDTVEQVFHSSLQFLLPPGYLGLQLESHPGLTECIRWSFYMKLEIVSSGHTDFKTKCDINAKIWALFTCWKLPHVKRALTKLQSLFFFTTERRKKSLKNSDYFWNQTAVHCLLQFLLPERRQ